MTEFLRRIENIYSDCVEELDFAYEIFGKEFDSVPAGARGLMSSYDDLKFIAIYEYFQNKNVNKFKKNLVQAANLQLLMFERFDNGEDIDQSYVCMTSSTAVFDALAAGNIALAKQLASLIGNRAELEKKYDSVYSLSLGYMIKCLLLDKYDESISWAEKFQKACVEWSSLETISYADCVLAIIDKNESLLNSSLESLIEGHVELSKKGKDYHNTEDQLICTWGIAFANWACFKGLAVNIDNRLLPRELYSS
jgi:hypothetical protein